MNTQQNVVNLFNSSCAIDVEDDYSEIEDRPSIDLKALNNEQLLDFIEMRINNLQDLKKRLHYYAAELAEK